MSLGWPHKMETSNKNDCRNERESFGKSVGGRNLDDPLDGQSEDAD